MTGNARRRRVGAAGVALVAVATVVMLVVARPAARGEPIPASYPEGPHFAGGVLYFAEMGADRVTVLRDGARRRFFARDGCGPTAVARYGRDGFVVLCHIGRRVVAVDASGRERRRWDRDDGGRALAGPNDAAADGRGGVYLSDSGTFSKDTEPHGRLLHLGPDSELRVVADELWYPNGVFVDRAAPRLYVSEHLAGRVLRFEVVPGGGLASRATFARLADARPAPRYATPFAETGPDGLEIGPDGDLYVAAYGEGRIVRFDRRGGYRGSIGLPTRFVTNITFSPDGTAVTTGSYDDVRPTGSGEVRFHRL